MPYLYRLFDRDDRLLYVGISAVSAKRRIGSHLMKPWGERVHTARIDWFESLAWARQRELKAIREEKPLFNVEGQWGTFEARGGWTEAEWQQIAIACRLGAGKKSLGWYEAITNEYEARFGRKLRLPPGRAKGSGRVYTELLTFLDEEVAG